LKNEIFLDLGLASPAFVAWRRQALPGSDPTKIVAHCASPRARSRRAPPGINENRHLKLET
jgi:hypothetical protein